MIYQWAVYCDTEKTKGRPAEKFVIQDESLPEPTECPADPAHTIVRVEMVNVVIPTRKTSAMLAELRDLWNPEDADGFRVFVGKVIDEKTKYDIAKGFEYPPSSGKMLSLSLEAQANWNGLLTAPELPSYPFNVSTLDNSERVSIADQAAATTLAQTAFATKEGRLVVGNTVKAAVYNATTISDIFIAVESFLDS